MKIFITGGGGLIASAVIDRAKKDHDVVATYHDQPPEDGQCKYLMMDITDRNSVLHILKKEMPQIVIHCAAMTDVDASEENKQLAYEINVSGTKNVADACKKIKSKLVYLSTDYIFDGKHGPYSEDDIPNPISYYGKTKYEAEKIVQKLADFLIIRSTVVYGPEKIGHNFVMWLIDKLKSGEKVKIVNDQYGNPTLSTDLADKIIKLIEMKQRGIFNVVGNEWINRYDFANKVADAFHLDKNLIKETTSYKFVQKAPRPKKGGLKTDKIEKLGLKTLTIKQSLELMKRDVKK